jgi:hypothetical protein
VIWDSGTVFVLGAGFTKGFLPDAPLLIDDFGADALKAKFAAFPDALALIEMELGLTCKEGYPAGRMNLERLMTRLAGGMPYDFRTGAERALSALLSEIKQAFIARLRMAKQKEPTNPGELRLFAGHCIRNHINCLTFNYDDVLDEALYGSFPGGHVKGIQWTPDWGYGFPCRPSESLMGDVLVEPGHVERMRLIKLHGSLNWRVPYGYPRPYVAEAIRHHETWSERFGNPKPPLEHVERLLESEPLMVPPVLTKAEIVEQPILRITWSLALEALKLAKRLVFIGYSMPLTDIAGAFLFREGLRHLNQTKEIIVVDYARDEPEAEKKRRLLVDSYRKVFPEITPEQFDFSGGARWIGDNLTEWLYDSKGQPVAFNALGHIVSRADRLIGTIRDIYPGRQDIWHGVYKGEIVDGNRLLRIDPPPTEDRGGSPPPPLPGVPRTPRAIGRINLPPGYRDIDWADEARLYAKPAGVLW